MSLNKIALKQAVVDLLTHEQTEEVDAAASLERIAEKLTNAIDLFVKSGTVNTSVNVATTGTATAQTGTGTGTGNIT